MDDGSEGVFHVERCFPKRKTSPPPKKTPLEKVTNNTRVASKY
jgi:hypothetical protein